MRNMTEGEFSTRDELSPAPSPQMGYVPQTDVPSIFSQAFSEHLFAVTQLESQQQILHTIANRMVKAVLEGKKIMWCGNGGSAADAQHLAAELVGRFRRERRALRAIALTTDTSILTSLGNDYGYESVFRRQVEAFCEPGDVLVGISTSGNSKNVCSALELGKKLGALTVALTGDGGGRLSKVAELCIRVSSKDTARIQEAHIFCGHLLCDLVELAICDPQRAGGACD